MEAKDVWGFQREEVANVSEKPSNYPSRRHWIWQCKLMNDLHCLLLVKQWEQRPDCNI